MYPQNPGRGAAPALLAALVALAPSSSAAAPPTAPDAMPAAPRIEFKWVDAWGRVLQNRWGSRTQWVWDSGRAVLRTWYRIPESAELVSFEPGARVAIARTDDGIAVDLLGLEGQGSIVVKSKAGGKPQALAFVAQARATAPYFIVDPSCAANGLKFQPLRPGAPKQPAPSYLNAGISCSNEGDRVDVTFFHSRDVEVGRSDFSVAEQTPDRIAFSAQKPRDEVLSAAKSLGRIEIVRPGPERATTASFALIYQPRRKTTRFRWGPGVGITYLDYREERGDVRVHGPAITAKIDARYQLIPRTLDVAANAFLTLLPLTTQTDQLPAFRSYGVNGRLGYRLPIDTGAYDWSFLGGYYLWGMIVPDQSYGVNYLAGPQLFIMLRKQQAGHRVYYAYGKLASISETFGFSIANREIATGGGYQLNSPSSTRLWFLTLDLSHAQFSSEAQGNSLKLMTATLGVSTQF